MTNITHEVIDQIVLKDLVELDKREDSSESIELLWSPERNKIYIRITDKKYDVARLYVVPNEKARDAFTHPHCYKD